MANINKNFLNLKDQYIFSQISNRVKEFKKKNPGVKLINRGIGDVTLPISNFLADAIKNAANEMTFKETFKGYGPYEGYEFIREKIKTDYEEKSNVKLEIDEIFIGCGCKEDMANIINIFSHESKVVIQNPVYPAYLDINIMCGLNVQFINSNEENEFLPLPDPNKIFDIIYICSPNNPTGAAYKRKDLKIWIDYAINTNAIILYDGAYEAFIEEPDVPKSIYEIQDSEKCAIEFRSFSKSAGFTGLRCSYMVIPKTIFMNNYSINEVWKRRISSTTNGVSYITQKAAEAVFNDEGKKYVENCVNHYKNNSKKLANELESQGIKIFGQKNSPYIWFKCYNTNDSWEFFDYFLKTKNIIGTPGIGFGSNGEGYFRLSSF